MDFQILYFINQFHCEILDKIMVVITHMGTKGIFWILVGVTILLFKQTRKCGLTVLIALLFSLIIGNILLKNIVARPRPVSYTHLDVYKRQEERCAAEGIGIAAE